MRSVGLGVPLNRHRRPAGDLLPLQLPVLAGPMAPLELLVLVRHAESARNVAKKGNVFFADDESRRSVHGIPDFEIPLTEVGQRQAERTGAALRERFGTFDLVVDSGYRRTVDTARRILDAYPDDERARMRTRSDLFVRERDAGFAYDMTTAEAKAAFPWLEEYWQTTGSFFGRPPGGESVAQVCERVHLFLRSLVTEHGGGRVLVVTHGVALRSFRHLLEGLGYAEIVATFRAASPRNTSVTTYARDPATGRLALQDYGTVYWTPET